MRLLLTAATLFGLVAPAAAQTTVVSPVEFATRAGTTSNSLPFGDFAVATYQQVHTDLRGAVRVWRQIGFRQGLEYTQHDARTVDLQVRLGDGDGKAFGATFASNFTGTPVVITKRRRVALPDWTQRPPRRPAPFTATIPFDLPYPYLGTKDLVWEVVVFSNSATVGGRTRPYGIDAAQYSTRVEGLTRRLGVGCTTTGKTTPARLDLTIEANARGADRFEITAGAAPLPSSGAATMLVGAGDPDARVPGLCANLRVLPILGSLTAVTNSSGTWIAPTLRFPYDPSAVGAKLHFQVVAPEGGRAGIPVVLTNGVEAVVPGLPKNLGVVSRAFAESTTATQGAVTESFGLIVELR